MCLMPIVPKNPHTKYGLNVTDKKDRMQTKNQMQTKKIECKQKTKTCHDANKKDRMQTKKDLQTKKKME